MTIRGKYQIIDKIGSGGMAVVYRVKHLAFGEIFAIKIVGQLIADNEEFLKRFKTEAVVTRKLHHPNAVRVDDLDTTEDGRPFILMEYVEGRSLRAVVQEQGTLPMTRALPIARQVCGALGAAHALGIVHRDIKPDNILLVPQKDGTDQAKVLDFGIAKVREGTLDVGEGYTPTQTGVVVGTPQYISPEQALGMRGDDIDGRADIYSLGVVLYEMLTGDLPFHSDTPMGIILHHIQTPPRPPRDARPDLNIPQTLNDVLMKALAKDPGRRFQTADEFLQALNRGHDAGLTGLRPAPIASTAVAPVPPAAAGRPAAPAPAARAPRPPDRRPPARGDASAVLQASQYRMSAPPRVEPIHVGGGGSSLPSRGVLTIAAFAALAIGFALMLPSPKPRAPRPAKTSTEAAPAGEGVAPAPDASAVAAPTSGGETDDAAILADVQKRLMASENLKYAKIEIVVQGGVVSLYGSGTPAQVELASALTRMAAGVKEVRVQMTADAPEAAAPPESAPAAPAADPRALELLQEGRTAFANGDYEAAIARFQAALDIDPTMLGARAGLRAATDARDRGR
jgi:serine/threonine-protein kinase